MPRRPPRASLGRGKAGKWMERSFRKAVSIMASYPSDHLFPFDSYKDYVTALSSTDNAYESLRDFFSSPSNSPSGPHIHPETQVPRSGAVMIMDSTPAGKLKVDRYPVGEGGSKGSVRRCIDALNERHVVGENRLISINYHRDPFTGEHTGLNTDIINAVAHKHRIHPEILLWHFGSDFGLDQRFFPFAAPPIPSALSSRIVCHLRHHHSYSRSICTSQESLLKQILVCESEYLRLSTGNHSAINSYPSHHICQKPRVPELGPSRFQTEVLGFTVAPPTSRASFTLEQ